MNAAEFTSIPQTTTCSGRSVQGVGRYEAIFQMAAALSLADDFHFPPVEPLPEQLNCSHDMSVVEKEDSQLFSKSPIHKTRVLVLVPWSYLTAVTKSPHLAPSLLECQYVCKISCRDLLSLQKLAPSLLDSD